MKTYTEPQIHVVICPAGDIVTLSVAGDGMGDSHSFDQVMNLN